MLFYSALILLTPFEHMVVPPPYSAYNLKNTNTNNQIISCAVSNGDLAALTHDTIEIYELKGMTHDNKYNRYI